eukprot:TRINITY_DN20112_c2_g3_i1.p1 TRINITY_DN20112_c2_g3~~TRINITY_DN20112_c2_g3_i1.p1  ORF type:complete len:669 (+),score=51.54 TRINITY_DN20112_c2_g3_i1:59-2065(+)
MPCRLVLLTFSGIIASCATQVTTDVASCSKGQERTCDLDVAPTLAAGDAEAEESSVERVSLLQTHDSKKQRAQRSLSADGEHLGDDATHAESLSKDRTYELGTTALGVRDLSDVSLSLARMDERKETHNRSDEDEEDQEEAAAWRPADTSLVNLSLKSISPACQKQLDAFCQADCEPKCAAGQAVVARYGSNANGNLMCYAASALYDMKWYRDGSKCYCSRAKELEAIRMSCEHALEVKGKQGLPISCQDNQDYYCSRNCNIKCAQSQRLYARHSGSPNLAAGAKWRCYARDALHDDLERWKGGTHCFCTRHDELRAIWAGCNRVPLQQPVFYENLAGVSCYRIPAIVQTASGILIAFAEARHGSCSDHAVWEIASRRSFDGGKTWGPVSFPIGSKDFRVGNPVAVSTRAGRTILMYARHTGACSGNCATGNGVVWSDDDGETWSQHRDISAQIGRATKSLPGPGNMVELKSGRIVAAVHKGFYENVFVLYSDDNGLNWTLSPSHLPNMDEVTIAQYPDGSVVLNMRHLEESVYGRGYSISYDDGHSWGEVRKDQPLVGPVCQGSLASFDGVVYFSNPFSSSARHDIAVHCSVDNGRTWKKVVPIDVRSTAGYTSMVQARLAHYDDPMLGILFESHSGGSISFSVMDAGQRDGDCLLSREDASYKAIV